MTIELGIGSNSKRCVFSLRLNLPVYKELAPRMSAGKLF